MALKGGYIGVQAVHSINVEPLFNIYSRDILLVYLFVTYLLNFFY